MNNAFKLTLAPSILAFTALTGCSEPENITSDTATDPQAKFWDALSSHCGKAYAGRFVSDDAVDADFIDSAMVMHVRECSDTRIAIPFHIESDEGVWDRSRTWLITKTDAGLRLKHDHRHEDGEEDVLTMYGGDTAEAGTARAQDFPVDAESIALFERPEFDGAYCASTVNTWTVEVDPEGREGGKFAYNLRRPIRIKTPDGEDGECPGRYAGRNFRVEFNLEDEVEAPPPAWGQE